MSLGFSLSPPYVIVDNVEIFTPFINDEFDEIPPLVITCFDEESLPVTDPPTPPNPDYIGSPVLILSATCDDPGITVTHTSTTLTVTGSFTGAFSRTLDYRDVNNVIVTTAFFDDVPKNFNTLFKYVAPSDSIKEVIVTATFQNHPDLNYAMTVRNNWQVANAMLSKKVAEGKF